MIIQNGWAQLARPWQGQTDPLDKDGYPTTPPADEWGAPLACQYDLMEQNQQAQSGENAYFSQQYKVYIGKPITAISTPRIRLTDKRTGEAMGTYKVRSCQWLQAVLQTCLIVEKE